MLGALLRDVLAWDVQQHEAARISYPPAGRHSYHEPHNNLVLLSGRSNSQARNLHKS